MTSAPNTSASRQQLSPTTKLAITFRGMTKVIPIPSTTPSSPITELMPCASNSRAGDVGGFSTFHFHFDASFVYAGKISRGFPTARTFVVHSGEGVSSGALSCSHVSRQQGRVLDGDGERRGNTKLSSLYSCASKI